MDVCVHGGQGREADGGWVDGRMDNSCLQAAGWTLLLRQGLLPAQPAAGQPADRTRRWQPGAHACVCVVPGCRGRCVGDTAPARPSRTLWAGSVGTFSLWSFSRVSPHPACTLSSHGRGVPALWGGGVQRPPSEAPSCRPPPLRSLRSFRGSRAIGDSGELMGIEPPLDIGLHVVRGGAHPAPPLRQPRQPAALSHPAGSEGSLGGRGGRGGSGGRGLCVTWEVRTACQG